MIMIQVAWLQSGSLAFTCTHVCISDPALRILSPQALKATVAPVKASLRYPDGMSTTGWDHIVVYSAARATGMTHEPKLLSELDIGMTFPEDYRVLWKYCKWRLLATSVCTQMWWIIVSKSTVVGDGVGAAYCKDVKNRTPWKTVTWMLSTSPGCRDHHTLTR